MNNIRREQFERWLSRFADHQVVGHTREYCDCPLARCISALYPWYQVSVANNDITMTEPSPRYAMARPPVVLPCTPWQLELIYQTDTINVEGRPIKAREVRAILAKIS